MLAKLDHQDLLAMKQKLKSFVYFIAFSKGIFFLQILIINELWTRYCVTVLYFQDAIIVNNRSTTLLNVFKSS